MVGPLIKNHRNFKKRIAPIFYACRTGFIIKEDRSIKGLALKQLIENDILRNY